MKSVLLISVVSLVLTVFTTTTPSRVRVVRDIDYVPTADYPAMKDRLDLYVPAGARNAPVIVSIHGGGLRGGDKSKEKIIGYSFATAGNVTVVVNYRLSPIVKHPRHVEDIAAAVAWVKRNVSKYGGDPDNIFVIGHSAGAYLAALLVLILTSVAAALGPALAGSLSPIPVFGALLAVFAHRDQGAAAAVQLLRGMVLGSFGFATFLLVVGGLLDSLAVAPTYALASAGALGVHGLTLVVVRRVI